MSTKMKIDKFDSLTPITMTSLFIYEGKINQAIVFMMVNVLYMDQTMIVGKEQKTKKKFSDEFIELVWNECQDRGLSGAIVSVRLRELTRGFIVRDESEDPKYFRNALTFDVIVGRKPLNIKLYAEKIVICGAKTPSDSTKGIALIENEIRRIIKFISIPPICRWSLIVPLLVATRGDGGELVSPDSIVTDTLDDIQLSLLNKINDYTSYREYRNSLDRLSTIEIRGMVEFTIIDSYVEMSNYNCEIGEEIELLKFFSSLEGTVRKGEYKRFLYCYQNTIYRYIKLMIPYKPMRKKKALPVTTMRLSSSGHISISGPDPEVVGQSYNLLAHLLWSILVEPIEGVSIISDSMMFEKTDRLLGTGKNKEQLLEDIDLDF